MSLISNIIHNVFNGVSQQSPELRQPSQAEVQDNAVSSPVDGLKKRPGTQHIAKVKTSVNKPLVHFINRDSSEKYAVAIDTGSIKVFDVLTGEEIPVAAPNGLEYLATSNPHEDLRILSVADYTFIVNNKRPVQMTTAAVTPTDKLQGTVTFFSPAVRTPSLQPAVAADKAAYWDGAYTPGGPTRQDWPFDPLPPEWYARKTGSPAADVIVTPPPAAPIFTELSNFDDLLPAAMRDTFLADAQRLGAVDGDYLVFWPAPVELVVEAGPEAISKWNITTEFMSSSAGQYSSGGITMTDKFTSGLSYTFNSVRGLLDAVGVSTANARLTLSDNKVFKSSGYALQNTSLPAPVPLTTQLANTNAAVYLKNPLRTGLTSAVGADTVHVINPLAFSANVDVLSAGVLTRVKVRVRLKGIQDDFVYTPEAREETQLHMLCGRPEAYYTHGKFLFNPATGSYDIPFDGFAIAPDRVSGGFDSASDRRANTPSTGLLISQSCGGSYGGLADYSMSRKMVYAPPFAWKLVKASVFSKASIPFGGIAFKWRSDARIVDALNVAKKSMYLNSSVVPNRLPFAYVADGSTNSNGQVLTTSGTGYPMSLGYSGDVSTNNTDGRYGVVGGSDA